MLYLITYLFDVDEDNGIKTYDTFNSHPNQMEFQSIDSPECRGTSELLVLQKRLEELRLSKLEGNRDVVAAARAIYIKHQYARFLLSPIELGSYALLLQIAPTYIIMAPNMLYPIIQKPDAYRMVQFISFIMGRREMITSTDPILRAMPVFDTDVPRSAIGVDKNKALGAIRDFFSKIVRRKSDSRALEPPIRLQPVEAEQSPPQPTEQPRLQPTEQPPPQPVEQPRLQPTEQPPVQQTPIIPQKTRSIGPIAIYPDMKDVYASETPSETAIEVTAPIPELLVEANESTVSPTFVAGAPAVEPSAPITPSAPVVEPSAPSAPVVEPSAPSAPVAEASAPPEETPVPNVAEESTSGMKRVMEARMQRGFAMSEDILVDRDLAAVAAFNDFLWNHADLFELSNYFGVNPRVFYEYISIDGESLLTLAMRCNCLAQIDLLVRVCPKLIGKLDPWNRSILQILVESKAPERIARIISKRLSKPGDHSGDEAFMTLVLHDIFFNEGRGLDLLRREGLNNLSPFDAISRPIITSYSRGWGVEYAKLYSAVEEYKKRTSIST